MTITSRRGLLAAIAASAAALPLGGLSGTPARAAVAAADVAVPVPQFPPVPGTPGTVSSVTTAPLDGSFFSRVSLGALTVGVLPGTPERTEVTSAGSRVALLTKGARTVLMPGPTRTFRENKRLFHDDFVRTLPNRLLPDPEQWEWGWGSSRGGGSWSEVNGAATDYEVTAEGTGTGIISLTSSNVSRHVTVRDDEITNVDVRTTARFDKAPAGAAYSFALSFGYQDSDNSYRARLHFTPQGAVELRLEKEKANAVTALVPSVTLTTAAPAGSAWTIRVRREGSRMQAKAWRADAAEPAPWTAEATDTEPAFVKGRVGVRAIASTGTANLPVRLLVDNFSVGAATWAQPPTVTHGDWVRVLPEPFDGSWTPELEQRIRSWAGSTEPDVLAYAAMFLPGASDVLSGAGPAAGKRVLGKAGYGNPDAQGYLKEGSDFHDYMGLAWTFPTKTVAAEAPAGNLDCSGYVRMVYGFHMGVPMAAYDDSSGTRLPRTSRQMVDHSPGVRVAQATLPPATFAPPAAPLLQPGDLVLFNADLTDDTPDDPVTPQDERFLVVDHVGIYLGVDSRGARRFLSSRKTCDGPTMADLAGASTLDGTGTYAKNLHTVHRI
ncbi:hypothetical protein [Streptomyces lateritius]|uniref:hypothetical protein n=1 Tax=Streptomyces lateritius TaxID=67313 RepID=UPI001674DC72|nr:hypothetical protein [Streptomyces lateritius]